jgi:predicted NBD/HSP70 family sugar kinase
MSKAVKKPHAVAALESDIVRLVRARGPLSRVELARELKLVASTAGIYADRLIRSGYLIETKAAPRGLGRPPVLIELNPQGGRFIGVDFDARQIMAVSVDFAQRPLARVCRTIPALATAERVLDTIEEAIREAIGPTRDDVMGIGLGVPGPVDADRGVALEYKFIRDWHSVEVKRRIAATFKVPIFVENNLRSMALGELWCGEGRGLRDLVCLGIRSGIGSGIIVGGRLLRGSNNMAGEIRRWVCPEDILPVQATLASRSDGEPPRTIEDVASVTAMLDEASARLARGEASSLGKPGDLPSVDELLQAAAAGDGLARSIVERFAFTHGWIVHQLALLLDPERVVIAGPLAASPVYLDAVQEATVRLAGPELGSRIVRSKLGAFAGARGAAAMAFHHWRPRRSTTPDAAPRKKTLDATCGGEPA